ncbi:hypothetical protein EGR_09568 [Echinococcus granulosus]|uniref:Uncharacterized protein n=1 Tax=Echinococcus granulosus TaxID=6210 RepID=W6U4T0_ECHGR|nr:hypothetical protein EGR_09568 [Echinococcus granulosus]EUB55561.1 hypothetical protein EGR_09568 [Echinococcus granulosus]
MDPSLRGSVDSHQFVKIGLLMQKSSLTPFVAIVPNSSQISVPSSAEETKGLESRSLQFTRRLKSSYCQITS